MSERAVVIGSGPGGSTAAMVLAQAGWDVLVIEKGRNHFSAIDQQVPGTLFGNDELKMRRGFGGPDVDGEPRTFRHRESDGDEPLHVGSVDNLPTTVAGGSSHWDAKVPRFWDIDFQKATMLGPIDGADVVDWPFTYEEIASFYDAIEALVGVQGDAEAQAAGPAGQHAPRGRPFPMPPGPPQLSSSLLAEGATAVGLRPFPFPSGINSEVYDGRPPCISCGFCSGFGCPIHDRVSALIPLRHALLTGRVELVADTMALRIEHDGTRASGVRVRGPDGEERTESADFVVLAAGAIESSRFALISDVPDPSGLVGRGLMFHWFTDGFGIWLDKRVHANRGRDTSHCVDDFCDPDFPGAREAAEAAGLPYFRGGVLELGGTTHPIDEALQYIELMELFDADKPFGHRFKELMRLSALRDRLAWVQMIAEDLAQTTNRVDLDPAVTDRYGLPVARVTYLPHAHELAAQEFYTPLLADMIKAAGAVVSGAVAQTGTQDAPSPTGEFVPSGAHIMGGLRMGADRAASATDQFGRFWALENVGVADSAVFPTSGAHNPTLTIMTTALRNARAWAGLEGDPEIVVPGSAPREQAESDGDATAEGDDGAVPAAVIVGGAAALAVAGGAAAVAARRKRSVAESE